jgi:hypothetical protein
MLFFPKIGEICKIYILYFRLLNSPSSYIVHVFLTWSAVDRENIEQYATATTPEP